MENKIKVFDPKEDSIFELFDHTDFNGPGIEVSIDEKMAEITGCLVKTIVDNVVLADQKRMLEYAKKELCNFLVSKIHFWIEGGGMEDMLDDFSAEIFDKEYEEKLKAE